MMIAPSPCACSRLRRAARSLTRVYDAALADAGLTVTQFAILRTLARLGAATATELAQATGHERSAMTRAVRPLLAAGLVADAGSDDRRSRGLAVTEAGRAAIVRAEPGWHAAQARIDAGLGAANRAQLLDLLGRVEALEAAP